MTLTGLNQLYTIASAKLEIQFKNLKVEQKILKLAFPLEILKSDMQSSA